jgi:hypothetical protein
VARWESARDLAISAEEEAQIEAVQKGVEYEETSRLKWFRYYVSTSEFDEADKLVVTPVEAALVLRSRATVPPRCCACIRLSTPASEAEAERYERFVQAIRSYHWEVAEVLALTPEEAQDVADSKVRVAACAPSAYSSSVAGARCAPVSAADSAIGPATGRRSFVRSQM